jgi:DNA invertase Pin-like site-specific DNA recombinase
MAKVGCARVSTDGQDVALKVDALKAAGCKRIFTETTSGAQRDRPELARALNYMRKGDVLVVWKLDRLARSVKQLIETIELLDGEGIGFQSVTEAMDTTTPSGRLLFHICGALAEFERGIIRERTAAGLAAARAQAGRAAPRESSTKPRSEKPAPSSPYLRVRQGASRNGLAFQSRRSTGRSRRREERRFEQPSDLPAFVHHSVPATD